MLTNPLTVIATEAGTTLTFTIYPPEFLGTGRGSEFFHAYVTGGGLSEQHLGGFHTLMGALAAVDAHLIALQHG